MPSVTQAFSGNLAFLRGNTAKNNAYTGPNGTLSINTDTMMIRVHDGVTAGGVEAARKDHTHTKSDIGLGNVDNTADANKAVLSATKLATSRTINGVAFDGTGNITINAVDSTARVASSSVGAANGVCPLDATGKVASTYLPSYVDDVLEYAALANFPATGETGKIYIDLATNKTYRWGGSAYIVITASPGSTDAVPEGSVNLYFTNARALAASLAGGTYTGVQVGSTTSLNMAASDTTNNGSYRFVSTGTGDANLAGCAFSNNNYGIKMGVRADGYFGIGGWSRAAWSWYSDASGNMVAAGNVTAYSDPLLKENFTRFTNALGMVQELNGGTARWKEGIEHTAVKAGKYDYVLMADEVKKILPLAVTPSLEIDGVAYDTVDYTKMIPLLVEAVKDLASQNAVLSQRLAALEGK